MKKFYIFTFVCLGIIALNVQGQKDEKSISKKKTTENPIVDTRIDNMRYWMKKAEAGLVQYNPVIPFKPAEYKGSQVIGMGIKAQDSPDVPVTNATDVTQSENSIFVDPNDNQKILNSNNSTGWDGSSYTSLYGANYFQSANGGTTFGGSPLGAGGTNSGDPTTAINTSGRQFINYISSASGQGVAYSDNGVNWTTATVGPNPGSLADKNHMWIDNSLTSSYNGNLYAAWTDFGGTFDSEIVFSRCIDDGVTWSSRVNLSAASGAGSHNQGVHIQTGPAGEVYVVWTIYDSWPSDETRMAMAKSTDGGATFGSSYDIITNINGIRNTGVPQNMRVNSFPASAVDISGGANNGNVYVVWTNVGTPGVNSGTAGIYMIKSTNGGTSWSTPVKVNQGTGTAYLPWIACDSETGALAVIFYDNRNTASASCEAWVAYSLDAGDTWADMRVSDVSFTPSPIPGLASGYMGDYLSIAAKGGRIYPCWTDNRGSTYMTYVSPFELGLAAAFGASNTDVCAGSSVTFTDQSSGPPTTWSWSFPGGSPSSYIGQNPPSITYNTPGTYDVSLTVGDGIDTDIETVVDYITVQNVFADFSGTPTTIVKGNTVSFTDLSDCSPNSWSWSFPGGIPSSFSGQNPPPIQYDIEGSYDVTLSVSNASGTDVKPMPGYITVVPPEFNMQNGTVTTCEGNFYDSGGPGANYSDNEDFVLTFYPSIPGNQLEFTFNQFDVEFETECDFDYLNIYNGENVSAPLVGQYCSTNSPGIVTASNTAGAITFEWHSDISVNAAGWSASISCYSPTNPPVAEFSASSTSPVINTDVLFSDLSAGVPTSWNWSFNPTTVVFVNGTNANSQNPEVQFTEFGTYTVSLNVTNDYGSDIETKTDYINVGSCTYCETSFSNTTDEWISNVSFNTISNPSGSTSYSDFTAISTDVEPGSSHSISVEITVSGSYTEHCIVFIDWDHDCDFTDLNESYDLGQVSGTGTLNSIIDVPVGAQPGSTRMRVSMRYITDPDGCDVTSYGEAEDYTVNVTGGHVTLDLKAYLEGPYNGTNMNSDIVQLLPLSQPFNTTPWNYTGTESVVSIPNPNVVDWVLIDVRDAATAATATSATSVGKQAAFILNDGSIVDLDGSSDLQFDVSISQNLFVVILQRNHLGIISNDPITPSAGLYTYDFTTGINQVFGGTDGHKEISIGIWGMIGGDSNRDGTVNMNDKSPLWENQAGKQGYDYSDHNLDGEINNQDKDDILVPNLDKSTQVPN